MEILKIGTSEVELMINLFSDRTNYNENISSWDVKNVTYMNGMFNNASSFNQDLKDWNVSNVLLMNNMFSNTTSFNQYLKTWNVNSNCEINNMFSDSNIFINTYGPDSSFSNPNNLLLNSFGTPQYLFFRDVIENGKFNDELYQLNGWDISGNIEISNNLLFLKNKNDTLLQNININETGMYKLVFNGYYINNIENRDSLRFPLLISIQGNNYNKNEVLDLKYNVNKENNIFFNLYNGNYELRFINDYDNSNIDVNYIIDDIKFYYYDE